MREAYGDRGPSSLLEEFSHRERLDYVAELRQRGGLARSKLRFRYPVEVGREAAVDEMNLRYLADPAGERPAEGVKPVDGEYGFEQCDQIVDEPRLQLQVARHR